MKEIQKEDAVHGAMGFDQAWGILLNCHLRDSGAVNKDEAALLAQIGGQELQAFVTNSYGLTPDEFAMAVSGANYAWGIVQDIQNGVDPDGA